LYYKYCNLQYDVKIAQVDTNRIYLNTPKCDSQVASINKYDFPIEIDWDILIEELKKVTDIINKSRDFLDDSSEYKSVA
jgi:hypothetical protein